MGGRESWSGVDHLQKHAGSMNIFILLAGLHPSEWHISAKLCPFCLSTVSMMLSSHSLPELSVTLGTTGLQCAPPPLSLPQNPWDWEWFNMRRNLIWFVVLEHSVHGCLAPSSMCLHSGKRPWRRGVMEKSSQVSRRELGSVLSKSSAC